ncbi:homeotic protein spalt-major-like isoform X2 [Wyeomyia smithii]|uniref:homeotic protein spalt-major-like isoform X2 n=1 Tax=Wyeomyia smithii TaxID=174621 RepID=UPI002467D771|nr:homeotic protein spalt-major-like isoform X2 [Wyeomyia smithii]
MEEFTPTMKVEEFTPTIKVEELIIPDTLATEEKILLTSSDWCSGKPNVTNALKEGSADVKQEPTMDITDEVETNAACDEIAVSYSSNSKDSERPHLSSHTKEHNPDYSYKCSFCDQRYSCEWRLTKHMHTHSDDRPFKCDICKTSYKRARSFKRHVCKLNLSSTRSIADEKLIELVRGHPVLFDLGDARFLDSRHKTKIWNKIAEELGSEANDCKSRWNNIRDQYRKTLKREVTRSGQAAARIRPYKYKHLLTFITPTSEEPETISNIEPEEPLAISGTEPGSEREIDTQEEPLTSTAPISEPAPDPKAYSKPRGRNSCKENSASAQLMKYLISKKSSNQSKEDSHPVDAFLSGIAPILKSLDPINLNKARAEIFATVQKYELVMLMQENNTHCNQAPSSSTTISPPPASHFPMMSSLSPVSSSSRMSSPQWSPPRNSSP